MAEEKKHPEKPEIWPIFRHKLLRKFCFFKFFNIIFVNTKARHLIWGPIELSICNILEVCYFTQKHPKLGFLKPVSILGSLIIVT